MSTLQTEVTGRRKPLRIWPGVVLAILQFLIRFVVPIVIPGGVFGALAVMVWWLFFSRAPWSERLGALVVIAAAMFTTSRFIHESIAKGAQGMLFPFLAIPVVSLSLVVWAVVSRKLSGGLRWATMVATFMLACGVWTLVRTGGFTGDFQNDLQWRWAKTPEERLLEVAAKEPVVPPPAPLPADTPAAQPAVIIPEVPAPPRATPKPIERVAEWRGFRGSGRDGIIPATRIAMDWTAAPPVKLWKRPVGPGWSSFAVRGDLLYTQEQRGPEEVVACYKVSTGQPVWTHRDQARFWESNAGAGPRATPTLSDGRVYTFGATGIVNALQAGDGSVVWSRNAAADTEMKLPDWGFAGSPLVVGDAVIVAASGRLAAYDLATGAPRWMGPKAGASYSSPHLVNIHGVAQVVLLSAVGATSVAPADGKVLWEHKWKGYPIVQPAMTAEGDILISVSDSGGTRRLTVSNGPEGWKAEERWTSTGLKPYFNDIVVHRGHAFGFDGSILACIDLADGKRKWKGGRYGHGQLVLLPDQDLLLVLSESGEVALVKATTDQFVEVAKFEAIEGKTWNHPVLVGDVLLARNSEEMAAFRLPLQKR
jgi:outer membrane protein assembly factor BamB